MIRVVIFARYSTLKQRDASIDDQIRLCRALKDRHPDWQEVDLFIERALSGSGDGRHEYARLKTAIDNRTFDVLLAEGLDRLTREQDEAPALYKRCRFNRIPIITVQEGEINELHVGLKGTMNALYTKDLGAKTHRGLEGRIAKGASAGGLGYGYVVVAAEEHGVRAIHPDEAEIVGRVFAMYRDGLSPKSIAHRLNGERTPGPRGGEWTQSTINGNRKRGTGILNNELYVGSLVWNRLQYERDPDTKKRRSREHDVADIKRQDVPHLRIVDQELWEAVKARQAKLDAKAAAHKSTEPSNSTSPFWLKRRPKFLFSDLLRCGCCLGGMSMISKTHLGCSNARNKGATVCTNKRTIKRTFVETKVLDALRTQLMSPEVYASFVRGFTAEWNKEQGARDIDQSRQRDELKSLERKIANIVDAIAENGSSDALQAALRKQEGRKKEIEAVLAMAAAPAPRLMPNLADLYREKVADLQRVLQGENTEAVHERVRALVEEIRLIPSETNPKAQLQVEVRGHLAAMLALATNENAKAAGALALQLKLVAGAGFEPAAFRL